MNVSIIVKTISGDLLIDIFVYNFITRPNLFIESIEDYNHGISQEPNHFVLLNIVGDIYANLLLMRNYGNSVTLMQYFSPNHGHDQRIYLFKVFLVCRQVESKF